MSWLCKIGIHNFIERRVEYSIRHPRNASVIEKCECGFYRVAMREAPTKIVVYDPSNNPFKH